MLDARCVIKPALSPVSFLLLTKHKNHNAYKIAVRLASGKCDRSRGERDLMTNHFISCVLQRIIRKVTAVTSVCQDRVTAG